MTFDAIDRAFIARWQARGPVPPSLPSDASPVAAPPAACPVTDLPGHVPTAPPSGIDPGPADLVARLIAAGRDQFSVLGDELEAARLAGHRAIGITGGERGEGRTTLVACLAGVLRDRGRDVVVMDGGRAALGPRGVPADGGQLHDKRIVLVDAGIWFPPGPIRRQRLMVASLGCDAAILVRRADRQPAPAWATALAAVGVAVLGEVVTFAHPQTGAAA